MTQKMYLGKTILDNQREKFSVENSAGKIETVSDF